MPDFVLIFVGSLVPICALMLALVSGEARAGDAAAMRADLFFDVGIESAGDDAFSYPRDERASRRRTARGGSAGSRAIPSRASRNAGRACGGAACTTLH